jgi:neamine transaminase/2'-deamino-2'-hydroxyneamine transaminase/neomycin C transaminase
MYPIITAIATLKKQKSQNIHTKINDIGNQFISEALKVINSLELPIEIKGNGNLFQFILYNDALSRNFFVESINQGLLFYVGDNQCISFAFNQTICGHALDRLEKVLKKLRKKFPNLVAKKVDATRLFLTAYNQIDGCIESMSYQQKINFINNIYKNRTFLPK